MCKGVKTDKVVFKLKEEYTNFVDIYYVENHGDNSLHLNQDLLKNSVYDWALSVDLDEYLILTSKYKTIKDYLQEKLNNNNLINCFYFRWAVIEKYDNSENYVFTDMLNTYKLFENRCIKSMIKICDLIKISSSHYSDMNNLTISFENHIYKKTYCLHKIYDDAYEETMIIHVHTRNIHDLIYKSFFTLFDDKLIHSKDDFIKFINNYDGSIITNEITSQFNNHIGTKATLPFEMINNVINNKLKLYNYDLSGYNFSIKTGDDNKKIEIFLQEININKEKYYIFINNFNEFILNSKIFIL